MASIIPFLILVFAWGQVKTQHKPTLLMATSVQSGKRYSQINPPTPVTIPNNRCDAYWLASEPCPNELQCDNNCVINCKADGWDDESCLDCCWGADTEEMDLANDKR